MRNPVDAEVKFLANGVSTNSGAFDTAATALAVDVSRYSSVSWLATVAASNRAGFGFIVEAAPWSAMPPNSWQAVTSIAAAADTMVWASVFSVTQAVGQVPFSVLRFRQSNPVSNYAGTFSLMVFGKSYNSN